MDKNPDAIAYFQNIVGSRNRKETISILESIGLRVNDSSGQVEAIEAQRMAEVIRILRRRRALGDEFLAVARAHVTPEVTRRWEWALKVRWDILLGLLERDRLSTLKWLRRVRKSASYGSYVIEFLQRHSLLPSSLPDQREFESQCVRNLLSQSHWSGLEDSDQGLVREYLSWFLATGHSERAVNTYRSSMNWVCHVMSARRVRKLSNLRKEDVDVLLEVWRSEGHRPTYCARMLSNLKMLFVWLREEKGFENHPVVGRHSIRIPESMPRPLNADQVGTLRNVLDRKFSGTLLRALWYLVFSTGIRIGEAIAVKTSHLDRESKSLTIPRGKGDKPGWLPISTYALDRIDEWLTTSPTPPACQHIFHLKGTQITRDHVYRLRNRLVSASGVRFGWHQLRTTFASRLAELKVGPFEIQKLLRHSRLDTILKYVKYGDEGVRRAYIVCVEKLLADNNRQSSACIGTAADLLRNTEP